MLHCVSSLITELCTRFPKSISCCCPQVHSKPSASRHYSKFKEDVLLNLGKCVKGRGADFAWKDHIEFTQPGAMPLAALNGGGVEPAEPVEIGLAAA